MQACTIHHLIDQHCERTAPYPGFLRVPAHSAGLSLLPAGGADLQPSHTEDEVYDVVSGRATLDMGNECQEVEAGSLVFVATSAEHRFHAISQDLRVLVFFASAQEHERGMTACCLISISAAGRGGHRDEWTRGILRTNKDIGQQSNT